MENFNGREKIVVGADCRLPNAQWGEHGTPNQSAPVTATIGRW
jgi:hypothetical protein